MSLARRFQDALVAGDKGTLRSLELAERTLGGPGSGWTAEGGHVPGAQSKNSGMSNPLNNRFTKASDPFSREFQLAKKLKLSTSDAEKFARYEKMHGTQKMLDEVKKQLRSGKLKTLATAKIPQAVVLYMSSDENEQDFTCGGCSFATPDGFCATITPPEINLETGSCGLYVPGKPHEQDLMGSVPAKMAGYEKDGPFTCSRCTHFMAPATCEGVAGTVEAAGCCNAWKKA